MVYNKKQFCDAINAIRCTNEFISGINRLGSSKNFSDGSYVEFYPQVCDLELCHALEAMFDDKRETVQWFCTEINYGAGYEAGSNMEDGEEWPLRNPEQLYDYLVYVMRRHNNVE